MDTTLRKTLVEYIVGKRDSVKLIGAPVIIAVVYETAQASKALYNALSTGSSKLVESALLRKKVAVKRFEGLTGIKWDL